MSILFFSFNNNVETDSDSICLFIEFIIYFSFCSSSYFKALIYS